MCLVKFVGIDLGWVSGASGLCCLEWRNQQLELLHLDCLQELELVWLWLEKWVEASESAIVAVDAPTIIPNTVGMRTPDKLTQKYFSRFDAGCYPANLNRPFAQRTIQVGKQLEAYGFQHAPTIEPKQAGRYQIEVFPHPATIHLFKLQQILKYKKGTIAERRPQLGKLRRLIKGVLPTLEPSLKLECDRQWGKTVIRSKITGRELKRIEDQLDSLLCAYVAAYWWYWGTERNWVFGDRTQGYIIIPAPLPRPKQNPAQAGKITKTGQSLAQ